MAQKTFHDFSRLYARQRFGIRTGLEGISVLLRNLGNPEKKLPIIHVAGSNGKGSVASLVAGILQGAGFRVGLYTSPHLLHFGERFRINGKNPDDAKLFSLLSEIEACDNPEEPATFFEITTAMAFLLFSREKVDFAVMETGMGGRWDATNIGNSIVSVITNISMEHTEILGDSLSAIASEKAGIIKKDIPLVTGVQENKALDVIKEQAKKHSAPPKILGRDFSITEEGNGFFTYSGEKTFHHLRPGLLGIHQVTNMALALAALEGLEKQKKDFILSRDLIEKGIALQNWPARIQVLHENPMVILDGAHNEAGANALAAFIKTTGNRPKILVFGVLGDKNVKSMLDHLAPLFSEIIFTRPDSPRARNPEELADLVPSEKRIWVMENPEDAFSYALQKCPKNGLACIAGSLFLAGSALNFFAEEKTGIR